MRRGRAGQGDFNQHERDIWVAGEARRLPPGCRVLDVGAGAGRYRALFSHCEYRAQDFAAEPSSIGSYTELDYVSDITAIPVPDASFDAILCTEVLEHVPDPVAAVREMARVLRRGGRLILTAPLGAFLHQEPFHFYGGYTPHWYRKHLVEAGFEIETLERNRGFFGWFGQEAARFSSLIDPRRTPRRPLLWLSLSTLWLLTLPFLRGLIPLLGRPLDRLGLETIATVGYHVVARRGGGAGGGS
jgi:SAM-dependent methyltransferase